MARINGPALSLALSGSIGNELTIQRRGGGPSAARKSRPTGPPSAAQLAIRDLFAWLNSAARQMHAHQRLAWGYRVQERKTSLIAEWTGQNVPALRSQANLDNLVICPGNNGAPGVRSVAVAPGPSRLVMTITYPNIPPGWQLTQFQGFAYRQQDPYGPFVRPVHTGFRAYPFTVLNINGLQTGQQYVVGAVLWWVLPSGVDAVSRSVNAVGTAG